jgi:hypothetical protein
LSFIDLRGARSSLYTLMNQGHAIIRKADSCKWLEDESMELESLRLERSKILQQLNLWHTRFNQLQADLEMSKSLQLVHAVALLSMYFTTSSIWLTTCLEKAQECYNAYHTQFKNILEAAELIVNISEGQPQSEILFTFEILHCNEVQTSSTSQTSRVSHPACPWQRGNVGSSRNDIHGQQSDRYGRGWRISCGRSLSNASRGFPVTRCAN